jgi:dodecin
VSNVYKKVQLVGTSADGIDAAVRNAVSRASETIRHLDWFEVKEIRGWIQDGDTQHFQVVLEVGFRLEPGQDPA